MAQRALVRGSIAVAAAFAMAVGCAYAAAPLAMADSPTEAVVPASLTSPPEDLISFAGPGGFLHRPAGSSGYVWTPFSGGPDIPVPGGHGMAVGYSGAGSDTVATRTSTGAIQLQDMDTGATATIVLPSGEMYVGTFGSTVLAYAKASDGTVSVHLLSMSGGQLTDTPVAGWSTTMGGPEPLAGDAQSVVVMYRDGTSYRFGLIDLATAQLTPLFGTTVPDYARPVLSEKYIGWYEPGKTTLNLVSRSDPTGPQTTVQVPLAQQPQAWDVRQLAIAGDSLLVAYDWAGSSSDPADDQRLGYPLYQVPISGGTPTPVVDHTLSTALIPLAPTSGGALIMGGPSLAGWGVQRVTSTGGAAPVATSAYSDPWHAAPLGGVSLADGQLFTVENDDQVYSRTVGLGGAAPSYGAHTSVTTSAATSDCSAAASCAAPIATGDGRIAQRVANAGGDLIAVQGAGGSNQLSTGVTDSVLVDSDGRYAVYNSASTGTQYVGDTGTGKVVLSRPAGGAALWESTLWTAGAMAGTLDAVDLETQTTERTVDTGASCAPTELQAAAGRWIYWSCGTSGPAGVYDLATGKDVSVPSAGLAQLGDGFLVEHDTARGELVLTDVHTDTVVTSDLAALPADTAVPDDRRVTWAVDRYPGGGIAYTDAQSNIHLVDPHIPASPARGGILLPGQRLNPGDSLTSGTMRLVMQSDGNLVAYLNIGGGKSGPAMWASGTYGYPGAYAVLGTDGSLRVEIADGSRMLWSSDTYGNPGGYLTLQDDGNLVLYRQASSEPSDALWASGTYARPQTISPGQTLQPGWWTQGTRTILVMQPDGNLVIYRKRDGAPIWASGTWGHSGAYAVMQNDGNLVVYPKGGGPSSHDALWASGTWGHSGAYAVMQNDGNLVVYPNGGGPSSHDALWASNTWQTAQ